MSERKELAARLRDVAADMAGCSWSNKEVSYVRRAADLLDPPAQGRTVRVRIAVAVAPDGAWAASGWSSVSGQNHDDVRASALESVGHAERVVWVEASVPLPEETTIEAEVTNG